MITGMHAIVFSPQAEQVATLAELSGKGAEVARDVSDQGWGLLAAIRLPDGSEFPIYQPRHPSPPRA